MGKVLPMLEKLRNEDIQTLLTDENPRSRALGILALYQVDNQNSLLQLSTYFIDSAACYKQTPYHRFASDHLFSNKRPSLDSLLSKAKTFTVGEIAKTLFSQYLQQLGYSYLDQGFETFVRKSIVTEYSAGFLKWLKLKATGGIEPFQEERRELVNRLKDRINKIPSPVDRATYKIYLSIDEYELYDEEERLKSLRFLGKRYIEAILTRLPSTKDQSLISINDSTHRDFDYTQMCNWILQNANYVFQKEDIQFLLSRAEYEEKLWSWNTRLYSPYWYIACANIDTLNAPMYIGYGLSRFTGEYDQFERAELYASLWHVAGDRDVNFILNWFFNSYKINERNPERLDHFIHRLTRMSDLKLLKHLIQDDRFYHYIKVSDVVEIARQINQILQKEVIPQQSIDRLSLPIWLSQFEESYDKTFEEYPIQVTQLLRDSEKLKEELRKIN